MVVTMVRAGHRGDLATVMHSAGMATACQTEVTVASIVTVVTALSVRGLDGAADVTASPPFFLGGFLLISSLHGCQACRSLCVTVVGESAIIDVVVSCCDDTIMGWSFVGGKSSELRRSGREQRIALRLGAVFGLRGSTYDGINMVDQVIVASRWS